MEVVAPGLSARLTYARTSGYYSNKRRGGAVVMLLPVWDYCSRSLVVLFYGTWRNDVRITACMKDFWVLLLPNKESIAVRY
jgi:hypothetical protein